ncbi:MAG: hypothetical protein WC243_04445 [Patescibacteria group bacterium]
MRIAIVGDKVSIGEVEAAAEEIRKIRGTAEIRFFRTMEELRAEEKASGKKFYHVAKTSRGLKIIVTKSWNTPF